MMRRYFIFER